MKTLLGALGTCIWGPRLDKASSLAVLPRQDVPWGKAKATERCFSSLAPFQVCMSVQRLFQSPKSLLFPISTLIQPWRKTANSHMSVQTWRKGMWYLAQHPSGSKVGPSLKRPP